MTGRGFFDRGGGWFGRGWGKGRGMGYFTRGFPCWGYCRVPAYSVVPGFNPREEATLLKENAGVLKRQLKELQAYIDTLKKAKTRGKQ